jgi:hypothetical protein
VLSLILKEKARESPALDYWLRMRDGRRQVDDLLTGGVSLSRTSGASLTG